jgi:hypothetical protein
MQRERERETRDETATHGGGDGGGGQQASSFNKTSHALNGVNGEAAVFIVALDV